MNWYHWIALAALLFAAGSCITHFIKLIRLGKPTDYARPAGSEARGIAYSFTGAMSPSKKESAYLHLPTYAAGLLYHAGTFTAIILLPFALAGRVPGGFPAGVITGFLALSAAAGIFILIKRMMVRKLRVLSNPDDYLSNGLVTLLQLATIALLIWGRPLEITYFLTAAILFLYLPLGKLKHLVYFFAARYQLGLFYGRRGVWPDRKRTE
ncbi:MAG: hypothetical protein R6V75_00255 [Bacteroidales bacterium]